MGGNQQRRAAKRRRQSQQRHQQVRPRIAGSDPFGFDADPGGGRGQGHRPDPRALVDTHLRLAAQRLVENGDSMARACQEVSTVREATGRVAPYVVASVLRGLLATAVDDVIRGGWGPEDLGESVRRRGDVTLLPHLAEALTEHARGQAWVGEVWSQQISSLGGPWPIDFDLDLGRGAALRLVALLSVLPPITRTQPPPGPRPVAGPAEPVTATARAKLARVRALLAKAESSDFDEEAEALSAKAQELISRYALQRLLDHDAGEVPTAGLVTRRIWLDAPYVLAKATLVQQVADANRCRSVVSEAMGCCTLVGDPADLDGVDLLVTSLLAQAGAAMLRHGRRSDRRGVSRTRSFRQSFLTAYALRIGERLAAVMAVAATEHAEAERLLPVLRSQETRVAEAFSELFPHVVARGAPVSNGEGWVAGRAAADQAELAVRRAVRG